jgi:transposase
MNPYSEDLRRKIIDAVERGMFKREVARLFGVSLSSVQRYVSNQIQGWTSFSSRCTNRCNLQQRNACPQLSVTYVLQGLCQ